jgi:origin recognition complex subunit 3
VPPTVEEEGNQCPSKRRKTAHSATDPQVPTNFFPSLLSGREEAQYARRRHIAFRECWAEIERRVTHLLEPVDTAVLSEIVQFVKDAPTLANLDRLPTGLISCGPKAGSQTSLLEQWKSSQPQKTTVIVVSLDPAQAANLMTALRNLIRAAITQMDGAGGYQTFLNERKSRIHMNYDLELLQQLVTLRDIQKCVIYLTDIEAFDMGLLTDLISVVSAWRDRIPFVLLLGISTTVDLFEARLSKSTIRLLDCRLFDASIRTDPCLEIYQSLHGQANNSPTVLGPAVSGVLYDMSREQDASAASLSRATKYAVMSHFFANALSIMPEKETESVNTNPELCEAIRSTDSFRLYAENRLNEGDAKTIRHLLNNDKALLDAAKEFVQNGLEAMSRHHTAVELFEVLSSLVNPSGLPPDSFLIQVQALSGPSFLDSALYTDLISDITSLPSDRMRRMLNSIQQNSSLPDLDIDVLLTKLDDIAPANTKNPLRSAYDSTHATASTTITNNKISLSKHGPKLSAKETEYTRLVDQVADSLSSYFDNNIRNLTTLFMHEAFVYDLKSPLAIAFTPRPRNATERALSAPYDYLGCECCEGSASGPVSPSQPPTSILWQLWCEAGGIVNVRDLWSAFSAIVVERKEDDGEEEGETQVSSEVVENRVAGAVDERMALALFYRGLAELRMIGFVKGTKRKADCLAKTAWKGL